MGGQLSWSIAEDVPEDLHGALFARDTLALGSVDGRFPPALADKLPDLGQLVGLDAHERAAAARAWSAWWHAREIRERADLDRCPDGCGDLRRPGQHAHRETPAGPRDCIFT
jgi:hypothetical protein